MKNFLLCLATLLCLFNETNAQNVIVVQHNGTPSFYKLFQDAVTAAASGDTIYLPGMEATIPSITIDKELHIIGAGWDSDSSSATGRTYLGIGYINLITGSSNSTFEGFRFDGQIIVGTNISNQDVDNLKFSRLYLGVLQLGYANNINADSCFVDECIINGLAIQQMSNSLFSKSTIGYCASGYCFTGGMGSIFRNCIFTMFAGYFSSNSSNCFYENCIVNSSGASTIFEDNASNNLFQNCLSNQTLAVPLKTNCYENVANIFTDYTCVNAFEDNDFHLNDPSTYLGEDGTQVGIYGTALPFKPGGIPTNPHISFKSIAPGTDVNGNLQINIKAAAQDH